MGGFTQADFVAMAHRLSKNRAVQPELSDDAVGAGEEGELHNSILDYLKREGLAYVHQRMDQRSTSNQGVPDFCIAAPLKQGELIPRTLWVECKTKTGKLSEEQQTWKFLCERAGHRYHIIRSMREFMELMK